MDKIIDFCCPQKLKPQQEFVKPLKSEENSRAEKNYFANDYHRKENK